MLHFLNTRVSKLKSGVLVFSQNLPEVFSPQNTCFYDYERHVLKSIDSVLEDMYVLVKYIDVSIRL